MEVKLIDEAKWRSLLNKCMGVTFFHTPDWYILWEKYADYKFAAYLFKFQSGRFVLFPVGWRERFKGIVKEYFSGPVGTYGGPLSSGQLNDQEKEILKKYLNSFKIISMRSNPYFVILDNTFFNESGFTQVIDLTKGWDNILRNWSKGHKSGAKKGIDNGVNIFLANKDQWQEYYNVYLDTFNRWGAPAREKYAYRLFENLSKLNVENCKLWLATFNGSIIAGALCFYFRTHVVYWHGASLKEYFNLRPGQVLQHYIIRHAIDNNYQVYDFNPSGGFLGVEKFKKGFGAKKIKSDIYNKQSTILNAIWNVRRKISINKK